MDKNIASPIQIAILSLFIDLKARFPNMIVGYMNRDRVREALEKGISSEQVFVTILFYFMIV